MSDGAKAALCWLGACVLTVAFLQISGAADITPGYTFTAGEKNITDVKLNTATAGTINTTFITGKSAQTPVAADTVLFYAAADAAYRKATLSTLFANAPAINGLSTLNVVGDFSVNTSKFTANATTGNTAVGGNLTVSGTSTLVGAVATGALTGTNGQNFTGGALISGNWAFIGSTISTTGPLVVNANQTNSGSMVLGDAAADTLTVNGTLAGTLQGTPTVTLTAKSSMVAADSLLISDSAASSVLKSVVLSNLVRSASAQSYVPGASSTVTLAHNLGGIPQVFRLALVCTNNDVASGYLAGDEVDGAQLSEGAANPQPLLLPRIEGTNVVVARQDAANGNIQLLPRAGGAWTGITDITNFNVKIYAVRFP